MENKESYNFNIRYKNCGWFIPHINYLLEESEKYNNSSLVIYACFEMRNLIEQIEYGFVTIALTEGEWKKYKPDFENIGGIKKVFGKATDSNRNENLKEKLDKYLQFCNSIIRVGKLPVMPLSYSMKEAQEYKNQLNDYCHLYTKTQTDFYYNSGFITKGKQLIKEIFKYLNNCRILTESGFISIGFEVNELTGETKNIYDKWIRGDIKSVNELDEILIALNNSQFNGETARFIGKSKDFRFGI